MLDKHQMAPIRVHTFEGENPSSIFCPFVIKVICHHAGVG